MTWRQGAKPKAIRRSWRSHSFGSDRRFNPQAIFVAGPVVRVFINASQLPSEGFSINHYRFAAWTQLVEYAGISYDAGISSVGSFAPENALIPIGVLKKVTVHP